MPRIILLVVATLLGPVAATAQAKPGDYLFASRRSPNDAVYAVTPWTNTYRTLLTLPTSTLIRGLTGGPLNTDYYVASGLNVFRVTPTGTVTTISTLSPGQGTTWADLDEDGNILVGTGWWKAGALFSVDYKSGLWRTITPTGLYPNAFVLDRDTGAIVYVHNRNNTTPFSAMIWRRKRDGTFANTHIIQQLAYSMEFHPQTGDVLIGSSSSIFKIDPMNTLSTWATVTGPVKSLAVQADGNVAVGHLNNGTIQLYDKNGKWIGTPFTAGVFPLLNEDMVIEDEHNVWGKNAMVRGGNFGISIRFAAHPGKPYLMAAALSRRPGIPIGGRVVPLTPDALFFTSLMVPAIFKGFCGTLDSSGCAVSRASIAVPIVKSLGGVRVFLAAVVIDPKAPSGIGQISQAYGATIQ